MKKSKKLNYYLIAIFVFSTFYSCNKKSLENPESQGQSASWKSHAKVSYVATGYTKLYEGVEYATGETSSPRLMKAYAFRVNLRNPDVQMYATPSNGTASLETNVQTTPAFVDAHPTLVAAVNANFYTPSGSVANLEGLEISNGTVVSNAQSGTFSTQLTFTKEKVASLISSAVNPTGIYTAVGGAEMFLKNGVNVGTNPDIVSRTGMGLSQDGKHLIIVVIDGRQPGWSEGANQAELADWMLEFGAWNGANFDGGGSSCLVRDNGGAQVLNRPSDGAPRAVGANLGVVSTGSNSIGPDAASWGNNHNAVATRGNSNHVYVKTWNGTSWSDWVDIGGTTYSEPAICSNGSGRLDVFIRGTDNAVWTKTYSGGAWSSSWTSLGGTVSSAPAAVSWGSGRIDVVARGGGNAIYQKCWNGSTWSSWANLGGTAASDPAICSWGPGRLDIFYKGTDNAIWHKYYNGAWSAWGSLGGTVTSAPAAVSWGDSRIDVVVRGGQNALYQKYWNGSSWSVWLNKGGILTSAPAISSSGANRLDVFARGGSDLLYQLSWTGTAWTTWNTRGYLY